MKSASNKFRAGQPVVVSNGNSHRTMSVEKVGRKYVHVGGMKFLADGRSADGWPEKISSIDEHTVRLARERAISELRSMGITIDRLGCAIDPVALLQAVKELSC